MEKPARRWQGFGWLVALPCAALVSAGCAGAGGAAGGYVAPEPGIVKDGVLTLRRPPVPAYGQGAALKCSRTDAFDAVLRELAAVAQRSGKPEPVADGRVCAVADAFLGWDPGAKLPPAVLEFVSHSYGLEASTQQPIVVVLPSGDASAIAERVVQALVTPALAAVRPLVGMSSIALERERRGGGVATTKVSVVLYDGGVEVDRMPRRLDAGQQATLTGHLMGDLTSPRVSVSDPVGQISSTENESGKDFRAEVKCGNRPGEIRVEVRGDRARQAGVLANFPVACAAPLADSIAVVEEEWPDDPAQAARKALDAVNRMRTDVGAPQLAWDETVAKVAQGVAESLRSGGTGADVQKRLEAAGVTSPIILQSLAVDRSAHRAHERLALSPSNRSNLLGREVTRAGVGIFATTDDEKIPLVYIAEVFVKDLPHLDVADVRSKLRDAVARKRKDARASVLSSDPVLEEAAQKYADALAAGGGSVSKADGEKVTASLDAAFRTVSMVSGAKQDPLDFAEEPQVVSAGKSLGVGAAQGKNAVLGPNATYVVLMVGTPRAGAKPSKAGRRR